MYTWMLPVNGGVWDLVKIGADKCITCCPPSLVSYWLRWKTGITVYCVCGGGGGGQYWWNIYSCSFFSCQTSNHSLAHKVGLRLVAIWHWQPKSHVYIMHMALIQRWKEYACGIMLKCSLWPSLLNRAIVMWSERSALLTVSAMVTCNVLSLHWNTYCKCTGNYTGRPWQFHHAWSI